MLFIDFILCKYPQCNHQILFIGGQANKSGNLKNSTDSQKLEKPSYGLAM